MKQFPHKRYIELLVSILLLVTLFLEGCNPSSINPNKEEWISLFDGSNFENWVPKFTGYELDVNYNKTFVLKDSLLSVRYTVQDTFNGAFGHLYYKEKFSYYRLKARYRFVGKQMTGGPGWALRNNGLMLHCQDPTTLGLNQDFPISLEMQLLGGDGINTRSNANLCTPGTNVIMNDSLFIQHCVNSTSDTFHGDAWVDVEAIVLGDSLIQHSIDNQVVLEYNKPTMGGGEISGYNESIYQEGVPIKDGFIAIQAETHPIDFKSIEILNLCGCMDKKAKNYKSYFVKADNTSCLYD